MGEASADQSIGRFLKAQNSNLIRGQSHCRLPIKPNEVSVLEEAVRGTLGPTVEASDLCILPS